MNELSMDEAMTRGLTDFFDRSGTPEMLEGIDDINEEITELVEGGFIEIDEYSQDANNIFLMAGLPLSNGQHLSINANLVWDNDQDEWVTFLDGSGPNDSYFEPDGEGAYRVVRVG